MKNELLFIGQIYQVTSVTRIPGQVRGIISNPLLEYLLTERLEIETELINETLLKKVSYDTYLDLKTKVKYQNRGTQIGELFVLEDTLISINQILTPTEKGKNLSRRKVLKRYNEALNKS